MVSIEIQRTTLSDVSNTLDDIRFGDVLEESRQVLETDVQYDGFVDTSLRSTNVDTRKLVSK